MAVRLRRSRDRRRQHRVARRLRDGGMEVAVVLRAPTSPIPSCAQACDARAAAAMTVGRASCPRRGAPLRLPGGDAPRARAGMSPSSRAARPAPRHAGARACLRLPVAAPPRARRARHAETHRDLPFGHQFARRDGAAQDHVEHARHRRRPKLWRRLASPSIVPLVYHLHSRCVNAQSVTDFGRKIMTAASNDEIRILTPSGMLGYGFPVDHFKMGLAQKPHAITIDSGLDQLRPAEAWAGRNDLQPRGLREGHRGPARGAARGQGSRC